MMVLLTFGFFRRQRSQATWMLRQGCVNSEDVNLADVDSGLAASLVAETAGKIGT